jgi:AcrR family transcriptional regulator
MSTEQATAELDSAEEFDRRDQILGAANECFTQLGIARTSVQDVARTANVSRGTVYRYFEDRNVLIEAAIEFGAQRFYAKSRRRWPRRLRWPSRLVPWPKRRRRYSLTIALGTD